MSTKSDKRSEYLPFAWASAGWLGMSLILAEAVSTPDTVHLTLVWVAGLWLLCLLDLLAMAKAVAVVLKYLATEGEKRAPLLIHAFYWAFLKLACLGIFTVVLFRGGRKEIPSSSLLLGMGTLVVVPLVGGFWWSHRITQDGSE